MEQDLKGKEPELAGCWACAKCLPIQMSGSRLEKVRENAGTPAEEQVVGKG